MDAKLDIGYKGKGGKLGLSCWHRRCKRPQEQVKLISVGEWRRGK